MTEKTKAATVSLPFGATAELDGNWWKLYEASGAEITRIAAEADGKLDPQQLIRALTHRHGQLELKQAALQQEMNAVYALKIKQQSVLADATTKIIQVKRGELCLQEVLVSENRTKSEITQEWYTAILAFGAEDFVVHRGQLIVVRISPKIARVGRIDFEPSHVPLLAPRYLLPGKNVNPSLLSWRNPLQMSLAEAQQAIDLVLDSGILQLEDLSDGEKGP